MIRQILQEEVDSIYKDTSIGCFGEYGAIIEGYEEVFIEGRAGFFIVSADEFRHVGASKLLVEPSARLLLAIGGLPKTEEEEVTEKLGVSKGCAANALYLRTCSRWSPELEVELIRLHSEGKSPNMTEFGCTEISGANLYLVARQD